MARTRQQARAFEPATPDLPTPAYLPDEAQDIWRELLANVGPKHFKRADVQVMVEYCVMLAVVRALGRAALRDPENADVSKYMNVAAKFTVLAAKLRLVPSSRDVRKVDLGTGHDAGKEKTKGKASAGYFGAV